MERERLILQDFSQLTRHTPAPWIVREVLRDNSILLIYGQRGSYKSFLALNLAYSIATGLPYFDHPVPRQGTVIYIAAEGSGGMVQRVRALKEAHPEIRRHVPLHFITEPVVITSDSPDVDLLIERIRELINWHPSDWLDEETGQFYEYETAEHWPVLIVVDTLARCFVGKENEQEDMGRFIQGVDRLRAEFHTSVLVVHHSGRDASHERGSTVLPGAADTIFKVTDQGAGEVLINCEKMKDSGEPPDQMVYYHQVTLTPTIQDTENEVLTSVVMTTSRTHSDRQRRFDQIMEDTDLNTDRDRIDALVAAGVSTTRAGAKKRIQRYRGVGTGVA